jgi:hypothetical protein
MKAEKGLVILAGSFPCRQDTAKMDGKLNPSPRFLRR